MADKLSLEKNQDWILNQNKEAAKGAPNPVWLQGRMAEPDGRHEAVLFIKPELTALGQSTLPAIFKLVDQACEKFGVEVMDIGTLGWKYMAQYNIAGDHYGVINKISREGVSALSDTVRQKIRETFHVPSRVPERNILGAHQFMAKFPEWTAETLGALWENLNATATQKLAPGTYAQEIQYDSENFVILGGFHPSQLRQFTAENGASGGHGRSIIVMPVRSSTPWKTLRDQMVGDTDPSAAPTGSLRATLLADRERLGIPQVSKGLNGIHLSAGPLEGMVEVARFIGDRATGRRVNYAETNFGAAWKRAGGDIDELRGQSENPMLDLGGRAISAFDATELMDMNQAITMLRGAARKSA